MFAEIVDAAGSVIVRAEGYVSTDGDITALVRSAVDRFGRANPDTSLIDEIGMMGFAIRFAGSAVSKGTGSLIRRFAL